MVVNAEDNKRKPGRPKGSKDPRKIKLKPSPKTAKEDYAKYYSELGIVAIYGVDDFTKELLFYMWNDPSQEFVACDPVEQHLANLTREVGNRANSMYRYTAVHHSGFIESGYYPVVVVSKKYKEKVMELPNPHSVKIICLEDYK